MHQGLVVATPNGTGLDKESFSWDLELEVLSGWLAHSSCAGKMQPAEL